MAADDIVEQVRGALDIADIIGERVKLRRSSRGYSGLCPFHDERTPSFHVYTDTQSYYCFGCHEAGNIFTFLMKTENMSFPEALKTLACRAGIESPKHGHKSGARSAYEILGMAAKFYADTLSSSPGANSYLERRKLDKSDITRFALGYAQSSWDSLVQYLRKQNVSDKQMLDLGLALKGRHGMYDKFRGRVIFPIKDIAGRVIAFGGRLIDGEGAKYINSPESEIYCKRRNLYLLDCARNTIREKKRSILVEGFMDAIRLHKCGFTEAVASLGTSLTAEQAEMLSRFSDRCYICYDSDNAGKSAMLRSMFVLQRHGLDVYVINLNGAKDPDEFMTAKTQQAFEQAINEAQPLIVQHIESFRAALSNSLTRKSAMKKLFESLLELDVCEVLQYKMHISEATGIPPSKIEEWFMSKQKRVLPEEPPVPVEVKGVEHPCEAALCSLLFNYAECRFSINPEEIIKLMRNPTARLTASALLNDNPARLYTTWTQIRETDILAVLARGDEICAQMKGLSTAEKFRSIYGTLRERYKVRRVRELTGKMQKSQATSEELSELTKLKSENHM